MTEIAPKMRTYFWFTILYKYNHASDWLCEWMTENASNIIKFGSETYLIIQGIIYNCHFDLYRANEQNPVIDLVSGWRTIMIIEELCQFLYLNIFKFQGNEIEVSTYKYTE